MTSRRNTRLAAAGAWMMAWSALAGAAWIALGEPQDPARVEGIVTYTGLLPEPIPITEAGTVRQLIEIEPKTKGLKDAVVWLDGTPAAGKPATLSKANPVQMDQRDYCFVPRVLAVDAGQQVEFLNHGASAASFERGATRSACAIPTAAWTAAKRLTSGARRPFNSELSSAKRI
ncbi:MAG: hypothetical protein WBQ29_21310 [Isosphaeraceae bacterium]